jgi:hypothetical protein
MELKVNRIEGLTLVSLLDTQETYNYLLWSASMARAGGTQNGMRRGSSGLSTTVMKTLECGGLQGTDKAVTTCRLPLQFCGVERNPR